ncbi:hypothetical protein [Psychromonas sp. 14N.309.X.WAT.B.A12]|uniref:hypothetical protein n=1 Tax=unclassified Psychromonas TaxID=2614957 RepID=UPI0025B0ED88|nr:hypothetical protein [Psychromonas sp. 14N.309.X.WAT.B.A12]MDN2662170.1 hypothetical protein [Psychromonas sp. 14N.309.X.WAT.B.A12]
MKTLHKIHKAPIRVIRIQKLAARLKTKRAMLKLKIALAQEKQETKLMLVIYKRYTKGQATKSEMKIANEQFLDILKGLGLGVFALLPFAPITIPIIIKLGKMVGVEVMPSAFHSKKDK